MLLLEADARLLTPLRDRPHTTTTRVRSCRPRSPSFSFAREGVARENAARAAGAGGALRLGLAEAIADSANMSAATVLVVRLDVRAVADAPRVTTVGAATGREDEYCVVNVTSATYPDADGSEVGPLQL